MTPSGPWLVGERLSARVERGGLGGNGLHQQSTTRRMHVEGVLCALVGASGIVVNNAVMVLLNRTIPVSPYGVLMGLGVVQVYVYQLYSVICFVVANMSNYTLNRLITFRYESRSRVRGWLWYLTAGVAAWLASLVILSVLLEPWSPLFSPDLGLDGSTGFKTPLYWANLIATVASVPISFLLSKKLAFPRLDGK